MRATIGVYGWTLDRFLAALDEADVRLLVDVRQRRGVRGSEYAWANAQRLEASLADAGIDYRHVKELAPTTDIRQQLYRDDAKRGVKKRARAELPPEYVEQYTSRVLDRADLESIFTALPAVDTPALFCVERDPEACHRGLIAARIADERGVAALHLRP